MEPAYSFSLPSIEDDTQLDCRIYHPKDLHLIVEDPQRDVQGAVVAHPYPPLGGCYDDAVVLAVTATLLDQGYIVGTFNFRGAGGSGVRTSWSGYAEQGDYSSVAGFMAYYLHGIMALEDVHHLETIPSGGHRLNDPDQTLLHEHIRLILAGYSYGSLVLARLPPMANILQRFETAEMGTAAAEIILRARTLAKQTIRLLDPLQSPSSPRGRQLKPDDVATSPSKRIGISPITMGGEETDPSTRRRSRDSRRSVDFVRKSVEMPKAIRARVKRNSTPPAASSHQKGVDMPTTPVFAGIQTRPAMRVRYLIISPVLLPFTQMLCPPGPPSFLPGFRPQSSADSNAGQSFLENGTLAIFGSTDAFTSARRLESWAQKMEETTRSTFEWHEIDGAGHFWREDRAMQRLQYEIATWLDSTVGRRD